MISALSSITHSILLNSSVCESESKELALDLCGAQSSSQILLLDNEDSKISSEVDKLVQLGNCSGTKTLSKKDIALLIEKKLKELSLSSRNFREIPSVRNDLCKLFCISDIYYNDLKEKVLDQLIDLLENDPVEKQTAVGVLETVMQLNKALDLEQAQELTVQFQIKFIHAFSAAVELYLRHYQKKHVNAVTEQQKQFFFITLQGFCKLNTQKDASINFSHDMASESIKRLISDNSAFMEVLKRLAHVGIALKAAYDKDLSVFFTELSAIFKDLDQKIKKEWYEALYSLRVLILNATSDTEKLITIQMTLATKRKEYSWQFLYGVLEMMSSVAIKSQNPTAIEQALFGRNLSKIQALESFTKEFGHFLGIIDFLEFQWYVKKATIATSSDRKIDQVIREKASELFAKLVHHLSIAYEGRIALFQYYKSEVRKRKNQRLLELLGAIIPTSKIEFKNWRGQPSPSLLPLHPVLESSLTQSKETTLFLHMKHVKEEEHKTHFHPVETHNHHKVKESTNPLFITIQSGDIGAVKTTLSDKKWLRIKEDEETGLTLAVQLKKTEICKILLETGANPRIKGKDDKSALEIAVELGQSAIVKLLAAHKEILEIRDKKGKPSLVFAALLGHRDICEILLQAGANPLAVTVKTRQSSLHCASQKGHRLVVQLFSEAKELVNSMDRSGNTPLLLAARKGHQDTCDILLLAGANAKAKNARGRNALHMAVLSGNLKIAQRLLMHKELLESTDEQGNTPLLLSIRYFEKTEGGRQFDIQLCEVLLHAGANVYCINKQRKSALHIAVEKENEKAVGLFSQYNNLLGVKDFEGNTPLDLAIKMQQKNVIATLLLALIQNDSSTIRSLLKDTHLLELHNQEGETPLIRSCKLGKVDLCKLFLKAGVSTKSIDASGRSCLHWAVVSGSADIVELLCADRELLELQDKEKNTPLLLAANEGRATICQIIIKAGADPFTRNQEGLSILQIAAEKGHEEIARLLSVNKKLLDNTDDRGYIGYKGIGPPLYLALESYEIDVAKILLEAGADPCAGVGEDSNIMDCMVNAGRLEQIKLLSTYRVALESPDYYGNTLLMYAPNVDVYKVLLQAGANPKAVNKLGQTVLHMAVHRGILDIIHLLMEDVHLIECQDLEGHTPLLCAVTSSRRKVCEVLLKARANPLAKNVSGESALHLAVKEGNQDLVELFASYPELIRATNKNRETPCDMATRLGYESICIHLKKVCTVDDHTK